MATVGRSAEFADPEDTPGLRGWARRAIVVGIAVLLLAGVLLAARRTWGAFAAELSAGLLLMTALVAGAVVFGGRLAWRQLQHDGEESAPLGTAVVGWGGSLAIVLLAIGCSLGGRLADWALWLPLVALDQWQRRRFAERRGSTDRRRILVGRPLSARRQPTTARRAGDFGSPVVGCSHPYKEGDLVLQRFVRIRASDGSEAIHGTMRAEFAAGQRNATLHAGFCPPIERLPIVEVSAIEGPAAEVKVTQAFCHGARLEVRLERRAAAACAVVVELFAKPVGSGAWNNPQSVTGG